MTTEGVNIDAMFQHENILDLNKLYCNNIHEMSRYYGVEAAAKTIVREICTVFKPYGIDVDKRHLTLIGDYMTFDGTYKPFNRIGEKSLKMSHLLMTKAQLDVFQTQFRKSRSYSKMQTQGRHLG